MNVNKLVRLVRFWYFLLFFVISISFSAAVETGCFLYAESTIYCNDISQEQAGQECSLYNSCSLKSSFYPQKSCSDMTSFPHCKKVLCKSSCTEEFLGFCSAGSIEQEKKEQWCNPGCCRLNYLEENHCTPMQSKWLCEIEAKNKDLKQFQFASQITEQGCINLCADNSIKDELPLEEISEEVVLPILEKLSIATESVIIEDKNLSTNITDKITSKEEESNSPVLLIILLLLVFAIIGYYFYKSRQSKELSASSNNVPSLENKTLLPRWFWLSFSPAARDKLQQLKVYHEHKLKEKQRQEFFTELGFLAEKKEQDHFNKLKRLSHLYEIRKGQTAKVLTLQEKQVFERLQDLTEKVSVISQKAVFHEQQKTRKQAEKVLNDLRELVKNKN